MKKRSITLLIVGLVLIVVAYIGYKTFILFYYNPSNSSSVNYTDLVKGMKIKDKIVIKHSKTTNNIKFKEVKIRNDFDKFTKSEKNKTATDSTKYTLYDENKNILASFWISITESYTNLIKTDTTIFGTNDTRITNKDLAKILKNNNINNDIELFNYLAQHKPAKNNLFTSTKKIKENFEMAYITLALPSVNSITEISGDYSGYILNVSEDYKEASILKNNKRYVFTFFKTSYFSDDYIEELLNTIEIDN